jgi:hypothetical protein
MTSGTLEHDHDRPGEYESLAGQRHRLLDRTNWHVLFYDYAQPPLPDDDEYNQGMARVPGLIEALDEDNDDSSNGAATRQELRTLYEEFDNLGYIRHTPPDARGRHATRPPANMAAYVDTWIRHTSTSSMYMRGTRQEQAMATIPIQRLQTLMGVANLHTGPLPQQIENGLWAAIQRIVEDYEESIGAERHNNYYDIRLGGGEHIEHYGLHAAEVANSIQNAQCSYPPELMRGLERVDALDTEYYYIINGQRDSYAGQIFYQEHRMELYMPRLRRWARELASSQQRSEHDALIYTIDETLIHEFAHLAHSNAPVEWLRRWEELNKRRRASVSEYAEHSHRTHPDRGRAEDFAEIARVYMREPLRLLRMSPDHFRLMDELLQSYDTESVRTAMTLVNPDIYSTPEAYEAIDRQLTIARQRTLERRIAQSAQPESLLGRVSVHLAEGGQSTHRLAA